MNDAQFKRATWDVVQNATTSNSFEFGGKTYVSNTAFIKWGDIDDFDTSEVTDMSLALSRHRNEAGKFENNGNNNMTVFNAGKTGEAITRCH
jgi:hypothetical protein